MKKPIIFLLFMLLAAIYACKPGQQSTEAVTYQGFIQGSTFSIKYFGQADSLLIFKEIDSVFRLMDHTASLYDSNSILSRVNRGEEVVLNPLFRELFDMSMEISRETNGSFDISIGQLVRAWGFYRKQGGIMPRQQVDSLRRLTGYRQVHLRSNRVVSDIKGLQLDFNAIAQGFTVDMVAEVLEKHGIRAYLIEIGGEVLGSGQKSGGNDWIVGIERPADSDTASQEVQQKIALRDQAIATSGNYRKFFTHEGKKYSHAIDPATGYPVTHQLLSATILAGNCARADALATACMVMGAEKSKAFLARLDGVEGYFIFSKEDGGLGVEYTPGFLDLLLE